jgi:hypothetical protein
VHRPAMTLRVAEVNNDGEDKDENDSDDGDGDGGDSDVVEDTLKAPDLQTTRNDEAEATSGGNDVDWS